MSCYLTGMTNHRRRSALGDPQGRNVRTEARAYAARRAAELATELDPTDGVTLRLSPAEVELVGALLHAGRANTGALFMHERYDLDTTLVGLFARLGVSTEQSYEPAALASAVRAGLHACSEED